MIVKIGPNENAFRLRVETSPDVTFPDVRLVQQGGRSSQVTTGILKKRSDDHFTIGEYTSIPRIIEIPLDARHFDALQFDRDYGTAFYGRSVGDNELVVRVPEGTNISIQDMELPVRVLGKVGNLEIVNCGQVFCKLLPNSDDKSRLCNVEGCVSLDYFSAGMRSTRISDVEVVECLVNCKARKNSEVTTILRPRILKVRTNYATARVELDSLVRNVQAIANDSEVMIFGDSVPSIELWDVVSRIKFAGGARAVGKLQGFPVLFRATSKAGNPDDRVMPEACGDAELHDGSTYVSPLDSAAYFELFRIFHDLISGIEGTNPLAQTPVAERRILGILPNLSLKSDLER